MIDIDLLKFLLDGFKKINYTTNYNLILILHEGFLFICKKSLFVVC